MKLLRSRFVIVPLFLAILIGGEPVRAPARSRTPRRPRHDRLWPARFRMQPSSCISSNSPTRSSMRDTNRRRRGVPVQRQRFPSRAASGARSGWRAVAARHRSPVVQSSGPHSVASARHRRARVTPFGTPSALPRALPFLRRRATLTADTRAFFQTRGYTEVETPYAVPTPGEEVHLRTFATTREHPDGRPNLSRCTPVRNSP